MPEAVLTAAPARSALSLASWRSRIAATTAAVVVAIEYVASPLTVLCGGATLAMCWYVVRSSDGRERTWIVRILTVTVGARFLFVAALVVATNPMREPFLTLFPDGAYTIDRSLWIRNLWLGVPIGPYQALQVVEPYGGSSYPLFLATLQYFVGPAPYGLVLFSTMVYVAGVLLLYRIVREQFGAAIATVGLGLLLVWPSLFTWSVSVLRESFQFFLAAVVAAGLYHMVRDRSWLARAGWVAAIAGAVEVLITLRSGTAAIAGVTIVLAVVFRAMAARRWVAVATIVLTLAAIVVERDRVADAVRLAANRHVGYVLSPGQGYRLLDDQFYAMNMSAIAPMTFGECARYLVSASVAFLVVPAPWNAVSASELALVPQQVCWYGCVMAAVVGIAAGLRRDGWLTCILAAYVAAGLVIIAPNSGNIGTLVRHRDMIVPFVLWLGVIGMMTIARATTARHTRRAA